MLPIRNFVGALAVPGKPFKEIEGTVKKVYREKALKKTQLYETIRKVKEGETGGRPEDLQQQKANPQSNFPHRCRRPGH
jgi:hypothetical protein